MGEIIGEPVLQAPPVVPPPAVIAPGQTPPPGRSPLPGGDDQGARPDPGAGENFIQRMISGPFDQVREWTDLGEKERARDVATSAAGMNDATRENLVQYFTERGLATTPEVDEAIKQMSTSMTIDWSDQKNVDAVFGSIGKGLEHGGPAEATRIMKDMSEFYQIAMNNPTFNRSEMLNIIDHWLKGDTNPKELAVRTKTFLDSATRDWNDPMSALGVDNPGRSEDGRRARLLFMDILTSLSERPDQQQKVVSQGARAYQAWRQQSFRFWNQMARRVGPEVYNMMGWGGGLAGQGANFLGDYNNPLANAAAGAIISPAVAALSVPQFSYLPFGQYGSTIGGASPLQPRRAATRNRFVRLAQVGRVMNPSIAGGQVVPLKNTPSSNPAGELQAFQDDMMKSLSESSGAADAAEMAYMQLMGAEKFRRLQQLKFDTSRLEQNLAAWEQDIRTGRGVADLRLIGQIDQMHQQLSQQSDEMMSLYDEIMAALTQRKAMAEQQLMQAGGQDPNLQHAVQMYGGALSGLAAKKNEQRILREQWLLRSRTMSNELRFQARQKMEIEPLQQQRDLLREQMGADAGASLALSAAEMAQAREKMQQFKKLQGLDPNVAGVQMGRAYTDAMKAYRQSLQDIDRSGQSAIPQQDLMETQGV